MSLGNQTILKKADDDLANDADAATDITYFIDGTNTNAYAIIAEANVKTKNEAEANIKDNLLESEAKATKEEGSNAAADKYVQYSPLCITEDKLHPIKNVTSVKYMHCSKAYL